MAPEWIAAAATADEADTLLFERCIEDKDLDFGDPDDRAGQPCAYTVRIPLGTGLVVGGNMVGQDHRWVFGGSGFAMFLCEMVRKARGSR